MIGTEIQRAKTTNYRFKQRHNEFGRGFLFVVACKFQDISGQVPHKKSTDAGRKHPFTPAISKDAQSMDASTAKSMRKGGVWQGEMGHKRCQRFFW